jgi:hypothetical protein
MPAGLVSIITPALSFQASNVWSDDLNPNVAAGVGMQSGSASSDGIDGAEYMITESDYYSQGQIFVLDVPLVSTTTTDTDSAQQNYVTDIDAFMALETGGEFEGVLTANMMQVDPSWSIPRYAMTGTTLDCDTSAPLIASSVFVHDSQTGLINAQIVSDGVGAYNVPVFEPGPYLVRAVNGLKTAISIPVLAEAI